MTDMVDYYDFMDLYCISENVLKDIPSLELNVSDIYKAVCSIILINWTKPISISEDKMELIKKYLEEHGYKRKRSKR